MRDEANQDEMPLAGSFDWQSKSDQRADSIANRIYLMP